MQQPEVSEPRIKRQRFFDNDAQFGFVRCHLSISFSAICAVDGSKWKVAEGRQMSEKIFMRQAGDVAPRIAIPIPCRFSQETERQPPGAWLN